MLCAGGIAAVAAGVRCTDAAREAARLAARGDEAAAAEAVRAVAPRGAVWHMRRDGGFVIATVTVTSVLPGISITSDAVAAIESTG